MHLPRVADRQMVGENFVSDKNESVLAEEPVRRAIVDELGNVEFRHGPGANERIQLLEIAQLLHLVAAVRAGDANDQRQGNVERLALNELEQSLARIATGHRNPAVFRRCQQASNIFSVCDEHFGGVVDERLGQPS